MTAIELLRAVWRLADREISAGDPIAVHEALAASAELAYCPLAYGYASYARPAPGGTRCAGRMLPGRCARIVREPFWVAPGWPFPHYPDPEIADPDYPRLDYPDREITGRIRGRFLPS